jgi:transcriptional regulator with XRE-family HTH domain
MATSRYEKIMKTFGKRLRTARENAGYRSAQSFSNVLGMEPHAYRKYERGSSEPNFETLVRICELLRVNTDYLIPIAADPIAKRKGGSDPPHSAAA